KAEIFNRGKLSIEDSKFILCKGNDINGGAIFLNINNEGYVTTSNSQYYQYKTCDEDVIIALIQTGGKLTIDGQCNYSECKTNLQGDVSIFASFTGMNSLLTSADRVKFEDCSCYVNHRDNINKQIKVSNYYNSPTDPCSGQEGNDEQINEGECTCAEGHHPLGCNCQYKYDYMCVCTEDYNNNPWDCTCLDDNYAQCFGGPAFICSELDREQLSWYDIYTCPCYAFGDPRSECSSQTQDCNLASLSDLSYIPISACPCFQVGDPRYQCWDSKTCDPSSDLSNVPVIRCPCDGDDDDPRQGLTCPITRICVSGDNLVIPCLCSPEYSGIGCTCRWNVSQTTTGVNIKSTIKSVIDLTCDNYEIQLIDSIYNENITISKQGTYLIKGREITEEQTQSIWSKGSGYFSLNQGIKTCIGGSAEEPTPKGCICESTKTEQECACQENDQRQPCICLPFEDPRTHCIGHTIPCESTSKEQLTQISTDICGCYEFGDPRSQCSESKACNDPSADLSNIPISLCPCNG
ncbi:MAG: hypothetical protein EZS28_033553, partial [Streblomastix strix]